MESSKSGFNFKPNQNRPVFIAVASCLTTLRAGTIYIIRYKSPYSAHHAPHHSLATLLIKIAVRNYHVKMQTFLWNQIYNIPQVIFYSYSALHTGCWNHIKAEKTKFLDCKAELQNEVDTSLFLNTHTDALEAVVTQLYTSISH